eukprot:Sspe_Gene.69058::Locus_40699_Transcript_1_1_Confidence_1.000_Length_1873::g.69058::m.69058/K14320/AAAS; aladin
MVGEVRFDQVKEAESVLKNEGVPPPAKGHFTIAELAGHLVHASGTDDVQVNTVKEFAQLYRSRWIATGAEGVESAARKYLDFSYLPSPVPRAPQTAKAGGSLGVVSAGTEILRKAARHPGLGQVIHHGLLIAPSSETEPEQPHAKKRRRVPGARDAEPAEEPSEWGHRYLGPPHNPLRVQAMQYNPHKPQLAILVQGPLMSDDGDGAHSSTVLLYDLVTETFTGALRCHKMAKAVSLAYSTCPGVLAVGCRGCVVVWDMETTSIAVAKGAAVAAVEVGDSFPVDMRMGAVDTFNKLLTGVDGAGKAHPWYEMPFEGTVHAVCFSNITGRFVAYGGEDCAAVAVADTSLPFDDAGKKNVQMLWSGYGGTRHLAFSPDDSLLLYTSPHRPVLVVYSTDTWQPLVCHMPGTVCHPKWHPHGDIFFHLLNGSDILCLRVKQPPDEPPLSSTSMPTTTPPPFKPYLTLCEHLTPYKAGEDWVGAGDESAGIIASIDMDPTGSRLVAVLRDGLTAVYSIRPTAVKGRLLLNPVGVARFHAAAPPPPFPVRTAFAHGVRSGSVLSIVWGDGLLVTVPLKHSPVLREKAPAK